jgi:tetratricopeptide (TPR) repeat protein
VKALSSIAVIGTLTINLLVALQAHAFSAFAAPQSSAKTSSPPARKSSAETIRALYAEGEQALRTGDLDRAERAFRQVLLHNDHDVGAYANLGVIDMRRKNWSPALENLRQAEHLAPQVAGIRLNIGLAEFRQNKFRDAIPPFESVLRDQPDNPQARQLLGLCYFFTDRWADATTTLEPLWPQKSTELDYLYVLGLAAGKAGRHDLEDKALGQLVQAGADSAEFHLFMGKAHLNRQNYDQAVTELETAARRDPNLPFVHFNLGLAYLHQNDYTRAQAEFEKDIAIEPDVAYDYEELGLADISLQQSAAAEKNFLAALRLDPQLIASRIELAKIYQHAGKFADALAQLDAAQKIDPANYSVHFLRGQVLVKMGRREEGRKELAAATAILNTNRSQRQKELEAEPVPSPELTRQ